MVTGLLINFVDISLTKKLTFIDNQILIFLIILEVLISVKFMY